MPENPSPLSLLSPVEEPDCDRLLQDIKDSLNRASAVNLWNRLQHNHFTRFVWFPGMQADDWQTRKIPIPGQKPPLPWPNSANLKVRLTDAVCNDWRDLLTVADSRTNPQILPAMLDLGNPDRMQKAEGWGAVVEYYGERAELEIHRAKSQWIDNAWEYGHAVLYIGWRQEKQLQKRTLDAETVVRVLAALNAQQAGGTGPQVAEEAGEQAQEAIDPGAETMAEEIAEEVVFNPAMLPDLIRALQEIDPDITAKMARRMAPKLRSGEPVDYAVPVVVRERPDLRALIPGLHVFYPPETPSIQDALFVVMPEWVSDVEMRARVETEGWDKEAVEEIISKAAPGRATFFDSISFGTYMAQPINWALTGGQIGMGVQAYDPAGEKNSRQWQLLTVRYRATDPDTGVPVMYRTTFHPDRPQDFVLHEYDANNHAGYPLADYKREEHAPSLWDSRGVGELAYSDQAELKEMADYSVNNAQITLRPPYEVSARSEMAAVGLGPGAKVVTASALGQGLKKIDIGGDPQGAVLVSNAALARSNDYFKRGNSPEMDPIAKQVAQQARVNDYMKAAKRAMRILFATIQQYAADEIRAAAVNGRPEMLALTKHDIQGEFSVMMEFDVADLDPKAVEARAKMLREMIAPLDNQGLLRVKPVLDLLLMTTFPKFGRQLVSKEEDASEEQVELAVKNMIRALNGIEPDYVKGGNPQLRKSVVERLLNLPALDDKGQPIVGPDGQPMPGRVRQLALSSPDVQALVENLMKHEDFEMQQQNNVEIGRRGVRQIQNG